MIPVLFSIGSLKVYSYGLMLGLSFLLGAWVLGKELRRKGLDPDLAGTIMLLAVVFGIAGAKLLFLLEEWESFLRDPAGMAFSPGGLTWYGGLLLAIVAVQFTIRRKKVPALKVWDAIGLGLILAYGVGRIGCHLSGDGDYGIPTTLPWGTIYAQGTAKPAYMLEGYFERNPAERERWRYDSLRVIPAGVDRLGHRYSRFDEVTPLHPTPIYELLLGVAGFALLWWLRTRVTPDGALFALYLILASAFRFFVEFLRLNPRLFMGLSEAQLLALGLAAAGAVMLVILRRKPTPAPRKE
jgi:phosphatidylglycerol:prolipoprotein diacylglycerol transferase